MFSKVFFIKCSYHSHEVTKKLHLLIWMNCSLCKHMLIIHNYYKSNMILSNDSPGAVIAEYR